MKTNKKIFFIGAGNMASAMIGGLISSGVAEPGNIVCNDTDESKVSFLKEKYGVGGTGSKEAAAEADMIVIACKPQQMDAVLNELKEYLDGNKIVISIAAGITTGHIESVLGKNIKAVRVMPNTPAGVLAGATALCGGKHVLWEDLLSAESLFSSVGKTAIMDESCFDAVTALSGSGPAYVFYLCELMQSAAEKLGLDKSVAKEFAVQTVFGAGKMLAESGTDASVLRQNVTSPNGTTQAALEYFIAQDLAGTVFTAMEKAARRSEELSR